MRDAGDLAALTAAILPADGQRVLIAHSMDGAIALLCLHAHRGLFDAAVLSAPMLGLATGRLPAATARLIAGTATLSGLGSLFVPGARQWHSATRHTPALSRTSSDPERCRVHQAWLEARPDLKVEGPTYGWVDAAFRLTERIQRPDFLAGIATPTLIGTGKPRLLGISKRGNKYLRKLLIHGARAAMPSLARSPTLLGGWLRGLLARAHPNTVVVALANKLARIVWAVLRHGDEFERADVVVSA